MDDGIGIPEARIQGAGEDHSGLIGMRERAARIGRVLAIRRADAGGTI